MADKNVQIKVKNGVTWDNVFPKTKAAITVMNDGTTTVESKITAHDTALSLKAPLDSPALTGTPTAPTAAAATNSTQVATTAFVQTAITNVINAAPAALDTLDELAAALGDNANFAATITTNLSTKAPLASPALTGTPTAPTAAADTSTTQLASTAFVVGQAASTTSPMNGTAAIGTSKKYARQDHVHPTDTTRAPLANPAFTGVPTVPTAAAGTNTTQAASTAYVDRVALDIPIISATEPTTGNLWYAEI